MNLLLVEDSATEKLWMAELLDGAFSTDTVSTLREALHAATTREYDAVLLDLTLPDATGVDGVLALRMANPRVPILVVTGNENPAVVVDATKAGADGFAFKSRITREFIATKIRRAIAFRDAYKRIDALEKELVKGECRI